jgi:hypothetical protein
MMKLRSLLVMFGALVASCGEAARQTITEPVTGARIKFFNFGIGVPGVNFFANDVKLTAISTANCSPPPATPNPACSAAGAEATTGTAYGAAANGGSYSVVPAGSVTIVGKIATTADNGVAVNTTTSNLEVGKYYSFFTSGTYDAATKKTDAFVIEDVLPPTVTDFTVAYVRFVNASAGSSPMTLFGRNTTIGSPENAIGGAVAYKAGGTFVAVPAGVYDLATRVTGSTTNAIARTAVSFGGGRVYTIASRGTIGGTGAAVPALDFTANR